MDALLGEQAGGYNIRGLTTDAQGGLWLGIRYGAGRLLLQHLNAEGAELARVDTATLLPKADFSTMPGVITDTEGRLYLSDAENNIHVLDQQGVLQFSLQSGDRISQLFQLAGGSVAAIITTPQGTSLREVNAAKRSWGERIDLPFAPNWVYSCQGYTLLYSDGSALYGYEATTNTSTKLLTWLECGLDISGILQVNLLENGRILCVSRKEDGTGQLIELTNSGQANRPDTTVLTLAMTTYGNMIDDIVLQFNEAYPDYQINIVNYYELAADGSLDVEAARERLHLDIISGKGPDMFDMEGLSVRQYAAIGLLEDLYPYLDADEEISRADIVPQLLAAWDTDGKLYSIAPGFAIRTAIGRADLDGIKQGMGYADFLRLMAQHPEADKPFAYAGSMEALEDLCTVELGAYVDWQAGACYFDSEEFISLLEFVAQLPREVERRPDMTILESQPEQLLASGGALLCYRPIVDFQDSQYYALINQGPIVFTGLPAAHGSGNAFVSQSAIAISSQSKNKEGCWLFLRFLLSQELQEESIGGLPSNQAAFHTRLKEEMTVKYYDNHPDKEEPHSSLHYPDTGETVNLYHLSQEEANQLLALIEATDSMEYNDPFIMTIVEEEAAVFLAGQISADEAANRIQSRASMYMNEQK